MTCIRSGVTKHAEAGALCFTGTQTDSLCVGIVGTRSQNEARDPGSGGGAPGVALALLLPSPHGRQRKCRHNQPPALVPHQKPGSFRRHVRKQPMRTAVYLLS